MVHLEPMAEDNYAPRAMELDTMSYDMAIQTFSGALKLPGVMAVFVGARPDPETAPEQQHQEPASPPPRERGSEQEREEKRRRASPELVADSPVVKDHASIVKELMRRIESITSRWPVPDNRGEYYGDGPDPKEEEEYRALMAELRALQSKPPQPRFMPPPPPTQHRH